MGVFSTITSPEFSELVIILRETRIARLHRDVGMFATLRKMHEVKPFKLVFLLEVPDSLQWEEQRKLEISLDPVIGNRLLDFLVSPPTVRSTRFRQVRWHTPHHGWD